MLIFLLACGTDAADTAIDDGTDDARITEADLPALTANQFLLEGPEFVAEPGADIMYCLFGTYEGPTVGLHDVYTVQAAGGHHLQLMGTTTPAIDVPDGTVVDCTGDSGGFNMADMEPIGVTNGGNVGGSEIGVSMPLPEGMAFELESGQRYVMQAHYINPTANAMRVRDLARLTTIPEDEVETWAAPLIFNHSDFSIPPGGELTVDFNCTTEQEWSFLYTLGHMHEWGTSFSVERQVGDAFEPFYTVPEWDPVYRDAPEIAYYGDSTLLIPESTTFRTTCSWFNDEDTALVFPHEMCVAVNIVYPQKATVICDGDSQ